MYQGALSENLPVSGRKPYFASSLPERLQQLVQSRVPMDELLVMIVYAILIMRLVLCKTFMF